MEEELKCINLITFLHDYFGIVDNNLSVRNVSHYDIKRLIPEIKRVGIDYLNKNLDMIYQGEIILVYDCHGEVLPYLNPHLNIILDDNYDIGYQKKFIYDMKNIDIDNLSKDELVYYRNKLRRNKQHHDEKKLVKAIKGRKNPKIIAYKRDKEELRRNDYGEY